VATIGAGVIGLSVATKLLETTGSSVQIHVIAESFLEATTSYNCGGLWEPYEVGGTSEEKILKWSACSLQHFLQLHFTCPVKSGAQMVSSIMLFETEEPEIPFWRDNALNFGELTNEDLRKMRVPQDFRSGYKFDSVVVDQSRYLPYLMDALRDSGRVTFSHRRIESLEDILCGECNYDVLVNCTGLGAHHFGDEEVIPIRGQVLRIR
jgi:glycine/D-amino acid oxidase-like deaminating enzyme